MQTSDTVGVPASETVGRARLARMRLDYGSRRLDVIDLKPTWHAQFEEWMDDAISAGEAEPNAMVVATADAEGRVTSRTVLCKAADLRGVDFYTNYRSTKSLAMADNPRVSATFPWFVQSRQVQVEGMAVRIDRAEAEEYWRSRPRGSRIGAWASPQSSPLPGRDDLDHRYAAVEERFSGQDDIPIPEHWGGWRIVPTHVEFWQGRTGRMHDRLRFVLTGDRWSVVRFAP